MVVVLTDGQKPNTCKNFHRCESRWRDFVKLPKTVKKLPLKMHDT